MNTALKVSTRWDGPSPSPGESLIVALSGELDIATVARLAARFDEFLAASPRQLVIDVSRLTFVDAAGLRALGTLRGQAEQRTVAVRFSGVSAQMRRLMRIVSPAPELPAQRPSDGGLAHGRDSADAAGQAAQPGPASLRPGEPG
jgi:anti-anti-sigma factor